jgi:hypothetical protein
MRYALFICIALRLAGPLGAQPLNWHVPSHENWNQAFEGQLLEFHVSATAADSMGSLSLRYVLEGNNSYGIQFDSAGNFRWVPPYDFVDRLQQRRDLSVIVQAHRADGLSGRTAIPISVTHANRPPSVQELPAFYVRQSIMNTYPVSSDYVYDADGDPLVFRALASQLPEGASLSSTGVLTWTPSRSQFSSLRQNPLTLEVIVQDQPEKAESIARIRIAQTQQDLPPEMILVPGDTLFTLREDENFNLKVFLSDPNGDDNLRSVSFVSSDSRLAPSLLKENSPAQYEFTWKPGYDFVEEAQKVFTAHLTFFALDKSGHRVQRKVTVKVTDAENLIEKDALLFQKYRSTLSSTLLLIEELDENGKKLNQDFRKAKKGKKNRAIVNASLGAITGFSPVFLEPEQSQVVSGIGGTTVLTMGTLEATEVIGKSKTDILERMKANIEMRNLLQAEGDAYARKYAFKSARRNKEFGSDTDKMRAQLNNQKLLLLELDAQKKEDRPDDKKLVKVFPDYSPD